MRSVGGAVLFHVALLVHPMSLSMAAANCVGVILPFASMLSLKRKKVQICEKVSGGFVVKI